jgi:hypothetical protein
MAENNQTHSKRGGARKGAGRKAGSATKKTREIADKAAAAGITPLEVMLENMDFAHSKASTLLQSIIENGAELPEGFDQFRELLRFRSIAQECAKDAAPYIHPKLAAIEHTGADGGAIDHSLTVQFVGQK